MRINSIEMVNYRQYREEIFNFEIKGNYDLHILIAQNGIGKTNFLNAITWCLYESEPHLGKKSMRLPIINDSKFKEMNVSEYATTKVSICISDKNKKVIITREMNTRKSETRDKEYIGFEDNSKLTVEIIKSFQETPECYSNLEAEEYVNKLFPKGIREHFFFDNEHLSSFFKETNNDNIKAAIHQLSQIQYLQEVKRKMDNVLSDLRREAGNNSPELDKLLREYESAKQQLNQLKEDYAKMKDQYESAKEELKEIEDELLNTPNVTEIKEKIVAKNVERERLENKLIKSEEELNGFLREYTIKIHLYNQAKALLSAIEEQRKKGELPAGIDISVLKESLRECQCQLCSSQLDEKLIEYIEETLKTRNLLSNESGEFLIRIESELKRLILDVKAYPEQRKKYWENYDNIITKLENIELEVETLYKKISGRNDIDFLEEKNNRRVELSTVVDTLYKRLLRFELNETNQEKIVIKSKEDYDKACKQNKKSLHLNELITLGERLVNFSRDVKTSLVDEIKHEIRAETFNLFKDFVWKKNTYSDVKITENYSIELIHKNGYSCIGTCSAAERSLLALAFTVAVHKASNSNAPLVIDSPVGRISDINRKNFSKSLKNISTEKQLIVIFTPSEYSDEVKEHFDNIHSSFYELEMNLEETETYIRKDINTY